MNNSVRTVVITIVTAVWAINFTAPIFVKNYTPSPELNVAFMAIIGVLTASYRMEKSNKTEEENKNPTPPPAPPGSTPPTQDTDGPDERIV